MIEGARALGEVASSERMVGSAVTLRFVPQRPDIAADKPKGPDSAEYRAFELCGENEVLVASSVGPWESIGGDIKFLRLAQRGVAGLVTDGSVRDTSALRSYGFPVYSHSTTCKQGPAVMQPWAVNEVINCGGV
jgi:regulator of RNase E activity RraA